MDGWDFNNRWNDFIRLFPLSCFKLIGEGDEGGGGFPCTRQPNIVTIVSKYLKMTVIV